MHCILDVINSNYTYISKETNWATDQFNFSNLSLNSIICTSGALFILPSQMGFNIVRKALPIRRSLDNKHKIGTEL